MFLAGSLILRSLFIFQSLDQTGNPLNKNPLEYNTLITGYLWNKFLNKTEST